MEKSLKAHVDIIKKVVDMTEQDLKQILESYGIDTSLYGKGEAKTLGHLLKEIKSGETELYLQDGLKEELKLEGERKDILKNRILIKISK